jgi:hypothetical protein
MEGAAVTDKDLIFRHRVRLFARACRELVYHRSWY